MDSKNSRIPDGMELLENLKKSHAVLRGVMESPKGVVILALDCKYRYIAFNRNHHQTMQQIWGVNVELGKSMLEYIGDPGDRLKARKNFDRALSGESFTIVEKYGDTALERRYYEDIYNPIVDEDGDVIGLTVFLTDITDKKQIEDQLQQRMVLERIISGLLSDLVRSDDRSMDAAINSALKKIGIFAGVDRVSIFRFGDGTPRLDDTHEWCADGIESKIDNLKNVAVDSELPWFAERIRNREILHISEVAELPPEARLERELLETHGVQSLIIVPMETERTLKGVLGFVAVRNRRIWTETDLNSFRFIGEAICVAIERNRAVKALRESEARLQFALEGAGEGVWDVNPVTNQVYYSSRWKRMLGYEEDEIGDTMNIWQALLHPDDREELYTKFESHRRGTTPFFQSEHRLRCKDGSYKWILARGKIIGLTEDGEPRRIIGTLTDISKSKQLEMEREKLIAELKEALSKVKQLSGLLPICSSCKKIRDDEGYWNQIESYIGKHSDAEFSHGICPDCAKKLYGDLYEELDRPRRESRTERDES